MLDFLPPQAIAGAPWILAEGAWECLDDWKQGLFPRDLAQAGCPGVGFLGQSLSNK